MKLKIIAVMNLRLILKIIVNTRTELLVAKCAENGSKTGDDSNVSTLHAHGAPALSLFQSEVGGQIAPAYFHQDF